MWDKLTVTNNQDFGSFNEITLHCFNCGTDKRGKKKKRPLKMFIHVNHAKK